MRELRARNRDKAPNFGGQLITDKDLIENDDETNDDEITQMDSNINNNNNNNNSYDPESTTCSSSTTLSSTSTDSGIDASGLGYSSDHEIYQRGGKLKASF